jgi:hypothetical protein
VLMALHPSVTHQEAPLYSSTIIYISTGHRLPLELFITSQECVRG